MPALIQRIVPESGVDIIRFWEKLRLDAYHDDVGFPTQGWGHLLSRERWADLSQWPAIDDETAERWFREDLAIAARSVLRLVRVELTDAQFGALTSFVFNLGGGQLQQSTLLRKLNAGDYPGAAGEFPRWVYSAGVKLGGLVRRRAQERRLFES